MDPTRLLLQRIDQAVELSAEDLASNDVAPRAEVLHQLVRDGLASLPLPAGGATLARWQALAAVAGHDLALIKLYEGHTDAVAILAEAGIDAEGDDRRWAVWAAEAPGARVVYETSVGDACTLSGTKAWCSGARGVDAALLTVWSSDGAGPFLATVDLRAPGVSTRTGHWQSVGMKASGSVDVHFDSTPARRVGVERFYLSRAGFWQGGIGIAACWHGGACRLARTLREQVRDAGANAGWHRLSALGAVDALLGAQAALLREAASWIDANPRVDARSWALRTRAAADANAQEVLRLVTRALGATPLCRDAAFARLAADLPVFIRQSHGDRDLVALGECLAQEEPSWTL